MLLRRRMRAAAVLPLFVMLTTLLPFGPSPAFADHTAQPTSVTIAGSLQNELGCSGDWQPECAATHLSFDATDGVWQGTWSVPAGAWEYKAALNNSWTENYGANAAQGGANIALDLGADTAVKFYYDHQTHWVADNQNAVIATVPGSFQSELGCSGDWQPDCLRSWLQDPDGDGTYRFETTGISAGSYEAKVAIDESWAENYGQGGAPGGANIPFTVSNLGDQVAFSYDAATHVLDIDVTSAPVAGPAHDNNVEWDGLRHDSRDTLYRTPGGAVPAGTPVTLRFRTFHGDVTDVKLRVYDLNANGQRVYPMTLAAEDVSCYEPGLDDARCDFWGRTLPNAEPNNLWYRFIVSDGADTDYYGDNTAALDGGLGATTDEPVDQSYALMVHTPGFTAPDWASKAVIYQIFPDRFRNGRTNNDPRTGDVRYDDPVLALPWDTKPEGYCRNYADGATNCPWRFDSTPPADSPTKEQPRGRDYMGGDLKGVDQQLPYLKSLGVNTIYFNPIFDAGSNHSYDTQDFTRIDPYFGTQKDWENLNKHADQLGIKIVLDGVFNHMSSDSPFFDRYGHYGVVGACESVDSEYRDWFIFRDEPGGPCAGPSGRNMMGYESWFGFDSIPVINKSLRNEDVIEYFVSADDSITRRWLLAGAEGWRLDVSGDASFPDGYWEEFRRVSKATRSDALLISETWQKDSTLLRMLRGDRLDTTMNYRLRDAVLGLLAPGGFDSKGFADSGRVVSPSEFAARLESIREDYSDATYYSLMNLLDSHDTERLLWTLTPGAETTAEKEHNAANVSDGKQRVRLASLIQYAVPGAPTVFYGDEVGMTGDDDPDDRRTYPWSDSGGSPDMQLFGHYQQLAKLRRDNPALTDGDFRVLLADDAAESVAFGRKTGRQGAIVVVNRGAAEQTLAIPVAGYVPDGVELRVLYGVRNATGTRHTVTNGTIEVTVAPMSGLLLASGQTVDLTPPDAPRNLIVTGEAAGAASLAWDAVSGAAGYNVYRSVVSGGGWERANASLVTTTSFEDSGLQNAREYFYIVKAVDSAGNESAASNEASALPHLTIGWANLQWPPTLDHTISTVNRTENVYGQVWIDGATSDQGATPSLIAQLGYGPEGSAPTTWSWVDASFNTDAGNNDEFKASLLPDATGTYDYAYRYSTTKGRDWLYADLDGPSADASLSNPGKLNVNPSGDTSAPATPGGLSVVGASPAGIGLHWNAVAGDSTLDGYEVLRGDASGGPYSQLALVETAWYTDTKVVEGATYFYVVRSRDTSFNRSASSAEVSATAALRTVTLQFNVTVPASTDSSGRAVHIAGFLSRLDGDHPDWNPGAVALTRVDATTWTITFTGLESTQIEYKYALGSWDYVEKDGGCGEIANRQLTLSYGSSGTQVVNDSVPNWRNVPPCGN